MIHVYKGTEFETSDNATLDEKWSSYVEKRKTIESNCLLDYYLDDFMLIENKPICIYRSMYGYKSLLMDEFIIYHVCTDKNIKFVKERTKKQYFKLKGLFNNGNENS